MYKNLIDYEQMKNMVLEHHLKITKLQELCDKLEENEKTTEIFFAGQIYDAYSKILDIFKSAKEELIIIDSDADNSLLDMIERLNIKVTLITKKNNLLTIQDIKEYHNLTVKYDDTFADCYFLLDNHLLYHCGASVNRIGYKTFSITKVEDITIRKALINQVNKIT